MTTLAKIIVDTESLNALRLRALAYETLKDYEREPRKAVGKFVAEVTRDHGLLLELIGYAMARDRALAYLEGAAADMRNETEGEDAQKLVERPDPPRSPPSAPASDDGDAQFGSECQNANRSPSSEATLIPLPKRGPAELKTIKEASPKSAFDSIRLRDNSPIGDLPWRLIPRYIRDNSYEAALLIKVRAYCVPDDQNALIRDIVPPLAFDRMVQQASQVALMNVQ